MGFEELVRKHDAVGEHKLVRELVSEIARKRGAEVAEWLVRLVIDATAFINKEAPMHAMDVMNTIRRVALYMLTRDVLELYEEPKPKDVHEKLAESATLAIMVDMMDKHVIWKPSASDLINEYGKVISELSSKHTEGFAYGVASFVRIVAGEIRWLRYMHEKTMRMLLE